MPTRKDNNACFGAYSAGTEDGNVHRSSSVIWNDEQGVLFYSAGPHTNRCQREPTQEKLGRCFGNNAGEWTWRVKISSRMKSMAVGEACLAIFWATPGFKGSTFQLWVLDTWVNNFCVRSTPLRDTMSAVGHSGMCGMQTFDTGKCREAWTGRAAKGLDQYTFCPVQVEVCRK